MTIVEYSIPVYVPKVDRLLVLCVKLKDTKPYSAKCLNGCFSVINMDYEK